MKILFRRAQRRGLLGWTRFWLWCELELDDEERAVIRHYRFENAVLTYTFVENLVRNAILIGAVTMIPAFFLYGYGLGREAGAWLAVLTGVAAGWFYYDFWRETIYVKDLLHGRHFRCWSVVGLVLKEEELKKVAAYFRQVLEAAKHWDGNEVVAVPAFDAEMVRDIIVKSYR